MGDSMEVVWSDGRVVQPCSSADRRGVEESAGGGDAEGQPHEMVRGGGPAGQFSAFDGPGQELLDLRGVRCDHRLPYGGGEFRIAQCRVRDRRHQRGDLGDVVGDPVYEGHQVVAERAGVDRVGVRRPRSAHGLRDHLRLGAELPVEGRLAAMAAGGDGVHRERLVAGESEDVARRFEEVGLPAGRHSGAADDDVRTFTGGHATPL
jgi:hypothetical protein